MHRRKVLTAVSVGVVGGLAGCSSVPSVGENNGNSIEEKLSVINSRIRVVPHSQSEKLFGYVIGEIINTTEETVSPVVVVADFQGGDGGVIQTSGVTIEEIPGRDTVDFSVPARIPDEKPKLIENVDGYEIRLLDSEAGVDFELVSASETPNLTSG